MMKKLIPLLLCLLLLSACAAGQNGEAQPEEPLSIVASTYPISLLTEAVCKDAQGVEISLLISQELSCLHNYTLTVNEMKLLEGADVLLINGAGLDNFVLDALSGIPEENRPIIVDCSAFVTLLPLEGSAGDTPEDESNDATADNHADAPEGSFDPHYWMDPNEASKVVQGISEQLSLVDANNIGTYRNNAGDVMAKLMEFKTNMITLLEDLSCREMITFHDGFAYFANAFGLEILMAVEEEEGQEASAQVIADALALIDSHNLPAIFTEVNSSDATAQAIGREAEISVVTLSMIMSAQGEETGFDAYIFAMLENISSLMAALG